MKKTDKKRKIQKIKKQFNQRNFFPNFFEKNKISKIKNKSVIKINTLIILKKILCYLIITIIICFPKQCLAQITTFLSEQ